MCNAVPPVLASWISDTLTVFSNPDVGDEAEVLIFSNGVVTSRTKIEYVYLAVDQRPKFQDGDSELMKFLSRNVKFPEVKEEGPIGTRIVVRFIVEKDGSISNIEVLKSFGVKEYDQAYVDVLASMPKWTPGQKGGSPVRVYYYFSVSVHWQYN